MGDGEGLCISRPSLGRMPIRGRRRNSAEGWVAYTPRLSLVLAGDHAYDCRNGEHARPEGRHQDSARHGGHVVRGGGNGSGCWFRRLSHGQ